MKPQDIAAILLLVAAIAVFLLAYKGWKSSGSNSAIISGSAGAMLILMSAVMKWMGMSTPPPFLLPLAVSVIFALRGFTSRSKMEANPRLRPVVAVIMQVAIIALIAAVICVVVK